MKTNANRILGKKTVAFIPIVSYAKPKQLRTDEIRARRLNIYKRSTRFIINFFVAAEKSHGNLLTWRICDADVCTD